MYVFMFYSIKTQNIFLTPMHARKVFPTTEINIVCNE